MARTTVNRKPRREIETSAYLQFARRILAGMSARTRVGGDIEALAELVQLQKDLDGYIDQAVGNLRSEEGGSHSWQEIGRRLGVTRSAAQQRWAHVGGARKPGGQPGDLR
jgi:hypothetical protein